MGGSTLLAKNYAAQHQRNQCNGNGTGIVNSRTVTGGTTVTRHPTERKLKKPLMEKRRRARINQCLVELKHILLQASPHQRTKLEKADILEMTVNYLRTKRSAEMALARQRFVDGFQHCSQAVLQLVQQNGHLLFSGSNGPIGAAPASASTSVDPANSWKLAFVNNLSASLRERLAVSINNGNGGLQVQQSQQQQQLQQPAAETFGHQLAMCQPTPLVQQHCQPPPFAQCQPPSLMQCHQPSLAQCQPMSAQCQPMSCLTLVIPQSHPVNEFSHQNSTTPMQPTPPFVHYQQQQQQYQEHSLFMRRSGSVASSASSAVTTSGETSSFSPCESIYSTTTSTNSDCCSNEPVLWRPW